jgi:hypothetical protein
MSPTILTQRLRALAEHPSTPPEERDSALRRLAELEAKVRSSTPPPPPTLHQRMKRVKARPVERGLPVRWPFGWEGPRREVEREVGPDGRGGIAVGWKCPSCGAQVERRLSRADITRMSPPGRASLVEAHIGHMVDGTMSQLCLACWDRWESA